MFKQHSYGETATGLVDLVTGRVILGTSNTSPVEVKNHHHLMVALCSASHGTAGTWECDDFVKVLERRLPYPYSHHGYNVAPSNKVRGALETLHSGRCFEQTVTSLRADVIDRFSAMVESFFPGFEAADTLAHFRDLLERLRDDPRIIIFTMPSPAVRDAIVALGGSVVELINADTVEMQAQAFIDTMSINTGWQGGEPQVSGEYEARWADKAQAEVCFSTPEDGEAKGTWHISGSGVPVFPPVSWRPFSPDLRDGGGENE